MSGFSTNLGAFSVPEAELMGFIITMKMEVKHHWRFFWIEDDYTSALLPFLKPSLISYLMAKPLAQLFSHGIQVVFSHIFCEGNGCADKLASHGHMVTNTIWWDIMPEFCRGDFFRDRSGLPNFCFP